MCICRKAMYKRSSEEGGVKSGRIYMGLPLGMGKGVVRSGGHGF